MKTSSLVDEFLQECVVRGLSHHTIEQYKWALKRLQGVSDVLPATRQEILPAMADPSLSRESRRDLLKCLRRFCGWAHKSYGLPNAAKHIDSVPRQSTLPRILTNEEIGRLLDATKCPRDRALIVLVLDTGLRLAEVANLRPGHIKDRTLSVNGKVGQRQVPISPEIRDRLIELTNEGHIWTGRRGPLTREGVLQVYRRLFRRAGIDGPKAGPHTLRHTFGTAYIRAGGGVRQLQSILGHQRIETTMIYVHLAGQDVEADHALHSPARVMGLLATC